MSAGAGCQATDQRGLPRPSGSACDIGAYEVTAPTVALLPASAITKAGATLSASVTPNAGSASTGFEFGTTLAYGSTTALQNVAGGLKPLTVSATLTGLTAGMTYHYRLVGTSPDGTTRSADATFTTAFPAAPEGPRLNHLKVSPARVGRKGAKIGYSDSEAAETSFEVLRKGPGKHRLLALGGFSHTRHRRPKLTPPAAPGRSPQAEARPLRAAGDASKCERQGPDRERALQVQPRRGPVGPYAESNG